jgi:hypothetical protein
MVGIFLLIYAAGLTHVSAESCADCLAPYSQQHQILSNPSLLLRNFTTFNQISEEATSLMECVQGASCDEEDSDLAIDVTEALKFVKSHEKIVQDQFTCISAQDSLTQFSSCLTDNIIAWLDAILSSSTPSPSDSKSIDCRISNEAYTCLRNLTICNSGKPTVGEITAEYYRRLSKSSIKRLFDCTIVSEGEEGTSKSTKNAENSGASGRFNFILYIVLVSVGAAKITAFIN